MSMRTRALTAVAAGGVGMLLLGACSSGTVDTAAGDTPSPAAQPASPGAGSPSTGESNAAADKKASDDKKQKEKAQPPGAYIEYADYFKNEAGYKDSDVVLFFSASWCPSCYEADQALSSEPVPDGLTVVKVDFDSSQNLKNKYGVRVQHTFVQLDGDGNKKAIFTGSFTADQILSNLV